MPDDFPYEQITEQCFAEAIGPAGLGRAAYTGELKRAAPALDRLRLWHREASLPLLQLPETHDDLPGIEAKAEEIRERADDVVILGTGGSSLGGQALYALADAGFGPAAHAPRLHFLDNIDPRTFNHLFRAVDLARTDFLVISKSGGTAETLTQFLVTLAALIREVGEAGVGEHVTVITEPGDNALRRLGRDWAIPILDHDPDLGGRYSVLSLTGLLPAAIAGLDIKAVRDGANQVLQATLMAEQPAASDPAVGAAINVGLWRERGVATTVLMPYVDRLARFASWFRQLWAESLGKGGLGTTPVRSVGAVDQHSQLQLYLDGPADKLFTLLFADVAGTGREVEPGLAGDPALAWLAGRTMGDLLDAEQRATAETLAGAGRPTRLLKVGRVDETSLGALMMHYMLETIIASHLLGVEPFDQPAVEAGKDLARQYLARMPARHPAAV
ncbi:MAG: glucose-6-phosphate isomerase [Alphaproteobacteria bacterium]|nr:glucose-6-phosphate isomerase [Alphaproteobacteria bacterium]